jgi:DNA polymerase
MHATLDFETYSSAGYVFDPDLFKYKGIINNKEEGRSIGAVGAAKYAEHPSTSVLCLSYHLPNQLIKSWAPGEPLPIPLLDYIHYGGLVEAHSSFFEYQIWKNICYPQYQWPVLPINQLRCSAAKACGYTLPKSLGKADKIILPPQYHKDKKGGALLDLLSVPRDPTKDDTRLRNMPEDVPEDFTLLRRYCDQDVGAEMELSKRIPDLSDFETRLFLLDQKINDRGAYIDAQTLDKFIEIYEKEVPVLFAEMEATIGLRPTQLVKLKAWVEDNGVSLPNMQEDTISEVLETPLPPLVHRMLTIRKLTGSASVKKIYRMRAQICRDGTVKGLFRYSGAGRTGRWAGAGVQAHNLPKGKLSVEEVEQAIRDVHFLPFEALKEKHGDLVKLISNCMRALFVSRPGMDLISSDFSAIEAVVLAFLAEEKWRMDVFNSHGKIYEMSASLISGVPFEEIVGHKEKYGTHHPLRAKIGKVAELALGYQGGVAACKVFGADEFMSDREIRKMQKAWRKKSPNIVSFWKKTEDAAIQAVINPGRVYHIRQGLDITFQLVNGCLECKLPSGRIMYYHSPKIVSKTFCYEVAHPTRTDRYGEYHEEWKASWFKENGQECVEYIEVKDAKSDQLQYKGIDSDTKQWIYLDTHGGKLVENIVQAVSRDILANSLLNLDAAGYSVVLHVHDEAVSEVPTGWGSIEEFEYYMNILPDWCKDWPVRASGGWRGHRFRKD